MAITRSLIALLGASALSMVVAAPSFMDGDTAEGMGQMRCAMKCYKDWLHGVDDWGCLPGKSFIGLYLNSGDMRAFAQCLCTDKVAMKAVGQCLVDTCESQTSVSTSFSGTYRACGDYNVHLPPPTELVTELDISVPTSVSLPSVIPGVVYGQTIPTLEDVKSNKILAAYSGNHTAVHRNSTNSSNTTSGAYPSSTVEIGNAAGRMASPKALALAMALVVMFLANIVSASTLLTGDEDDILDTGKGDGSKADNDELNIYGIEWNEDDRAPQCSHACMETMGKDIPQCILDTMGSGWTPEKLQKIWEGNDADLLKKYYKASGCVCTDKDYVEQLANCMFKNCAGNNTDIYAATSFGYKICSAQYNVLFPSPPDVVEILGVTVPKNVVVPTTVTGVPEATGWPTTTSGSPTTTSSATPSSSSSAESRKRTNATSMFDSSALKTGPGGPFAIVSGMIVGAVVVLLAL